MSVGDQVLSFNPDTGQNEPGTVTDTHVHDQVPTLRVTTTAGEVITTATHPFYAEGRGYTPAGDLHEGDRLRTPDGNQVTVTIIQPTGKTTPSTTSPSKNCTTTSPSATKQYWYTMREAGEVVTQQETI